MMDLRDNDAKAKDAAAVKRDDFDHARESHSGLRQLARATLNPLRSTDAERKVKARLKDPYRRCKRVNASVPRASRWVTNQLEDAQMWLQSYRDDIGIPEIETESGRKNAEKQYQSHSDPTLHATDLYEMSDYESAGAIDMTGFACYQEVAERVNFDFSVPEAPAATFEGTKYHPRFVPAEKVVCHYLRPRTPVVERTATVKLPYYGWDGVRKHVLEARSESLRGHLSRQATRLRWQGMEEWDAVAKADAKLTEGLKRRKAKSGAKPLPTMARLHELFAVRGDDLINRRLERVVTGKQVKIDGQVYHTHRVAYAIASGVDPAQKIVRDGEATDYRTREGAAIERADGLYDALVYVDGKAITVGQYRNQEQARRACVIYYRAMELGL